MSTSQKAVTPCGWGVNASVIRVWVAGKTHGPYLSALEIKDLYNYKGLYKFICLLYFLLLPDALIVALSLSQNNK